MLIKLKYLKILLRGRRGRPWLSSAKRGEEPLNLYLLRKDINNDKNK